MTRRAHGESEEIATAWQDWAVSSEALGRRHRSVVYPIVIILAMAGVGIAAVPYRARGSRYHVGAFAAFSADCANDEGEAVADGLAQPGAQDRCLRIAEHRLAVSVLLVLPLAAIVFLDLRRRARTRATIFTDPPFYP